MKKIINFFIIIIFIIISYFSIDFFILKKELKINEIEIEKGENFKDVYFKLGLEYGFLEKIFLKFTPIYSNLKAGVYKLDDKMTRYEILVNINKNEANNIKLTIPEGFTQEQIFERIENLKLASKEEMLIALNSIDFPYYHEKDNFEGYLYPETYVFSKNVSATQIANTILSEFSKRFPIEEIDNKKEFYNLLKLASIVEFETSKKEEKAMVAGVFKKRLEINMLLQSDATLKYITKRQALKKELMSMDSLYNSYKYKGLPPTPITNPSYETIIETKNAKVGEYLYFFMDKNGNTYFSKTHEEHLKKRRSVD